MVKYLFNLYYIKNTKIVKYNIWLNVYFINITQNTKIVKKFK